MQDIAATTKIDLLRNLMDNRFVEYGDLVKGPFAEAHKNFDKIYSRFSKEQTPNNKFINKIICEDSMSLLPQLPSNSVDVVITDPPYFLDRMDANWKHSSVANPNNRNVVKSLPAGMKFDRKQGHNLYEWYLKVSYELLRILKPGGFFFSFSSPRLYHRMASAIDDAGFEIRDSFMWLYTQNQPKAMGLQHFIAKLDVSNKAKQELNTKLADWKTPQIKSCFEPIAVAQKPPEKTYLENMRKYQVGLLNTSVKLGDNMYPSNVMSTDNIDPTIDRTFLISKPTKKEKGEYNLHSTVKPLQLCEHLIKLTAFAEDAIVLDPFVGSGTVAVAAKKNGKRYIGIDANTEYVDIANRRLTDLDDMQEYDNDEQEALEIQLKLQAVS